MPTIAIVGAGLIGRSWAIVFARGGWDVRLTDPSAETLAAAPGLIRRGLEELAEYQLVEDVDAAAARVTVASSLADAIQGVDFVQENGPEDLEAKRRIFAELDAAAPPHAILASSTSAIVASLFTENLKGRARCLVAHPVNPPHLVPIVELCGAPWTAPEVIETARRFYDSVGQAPITVHREIEGFVLNRLQVALLSEAFRLVGEGVVSPTDLDKTIAEGLGLRWSFMGPFQTI
ncbi:MAG: 3-hydroxyacyl-CoA dehydrogenase, partial [Microvirga sp.]